MLQKRFGQSDQFETTEDICRNAGLATAETARSTNSSPTKTQHDDEKLSLFWRVFGGTILSIVALGAITLYNSLSTNIAELRGELNREREARAEMVKKDEYNSRANSQSEHIRTLEGLKAEFEGLKERASANTTSLDGLKKDVGGTADMVKKDAASLDVLKEKMASATVDLKSIRDDMMKVQQEQERNRTADLERKTSRDTQHKQIEESMKELQKGLQDCREKLARLEGMQPMGATRGGFVPFESPAGSPRPMAPAETKGMGNTTGSGAGKTNNVADATSGTSKPGPDEERDRN